MSLNAPIFFGFTIGVIAYILLYLGKGIQKYAIEGFKDDKTGKGKGKNSGIWASGLALTTSYMFIQWIALLYAPINLIAPLGGIGLIVLILFSYFVLKEEISNVQIIGIILIILGMIFVTIFNTNSGQIGATDFNFQLFLIISLTLVIIEIIAIIIIKYNDYIAAGLVIGITAGSFNALQTVSKRITAIPDPTLTVLFTGATFLTATLTMLIQQFAFAKAKANVTIPCYTSASIIIAIIIGLAALSEKIVLIQLFGIGLLISGVICVSAFNKEQTTGD